MSIHAKRAAVAGAVVLAFGFVRITWPLLTLLTGLDSGSGGLGAVLLDPIEALVYVGLAVIIGGLVYWVSEQASHRSTAPR
jgi:hypothetical protein